MSFVAENKKLHIQIYIDIHTHTIILEKTEKIEEKKHRIEFDHNFDFFLSFSIIKIRETRLTRKNRQE